jgi:hypothetical protein
MKEIVEKKYLIVKIESIEEQELLPGYPTYPASEDIYSQCKEESEINPEEIEKKKNIERGDGFDEFNVNDFENHMSGDDLDVPGSELDDVQESIGSEDEENNYYSLGGDDHDNLDENKDK